MEKSKFEDCSVEQLEDIIMRLYNHGLYRRERTKKVKDELNEALRERQYKINRTFEWTPGNREKLLHLNQKMIQCWEKLDAEARQTRQTLQKRLDDSDGFLHDFEIEATVSSFIYVPGGDGEFYEAEDCIEEVLIDSMDLPHCGVNHTTYSGDDHEIIYLCRDQNWNTEPLFEGHFDGHFISQAIHDLYDHTHLSFPDILKINRLWGELQVTHQHFTEL